MHNAVCQEQRCLPGTTLFARNNAVCQEHGGCHGESRAVQHRLAIGREHLPLCVIAFIATVGMPLRLVLTDPGREAAPAGRNQAIPDNTSFGNAVELHG